MRFLKLPHHTLVELSHLTRTEKCPALIPVYLALLYHADSHGRCFPGYRRIMEISGIGSERTVAKALKILKREGLVLVDASHGKHGSNRYLLPTLLSKDLNFTEESLKLYSVKSQTLLSKDELYPINYTQLTRTRELEENPPDFLFSKGRKEKGKEKHDNTYQLPPELCGWEKEEYRIPEWVLGDEDQKR